jgi:hypothetical protein
MSKDNQMQTCECKVALADKRSVVLRRGITPAEAIILMEIHGDHAIMEPVQKENVSRTTMEEKSILCAKYDRPQRMIVERMFPGHDPRIPMTFEEANIDVKLAPAVKREKGNITTVTGGKADLKSSSKDMKKAAQEMPAEESVVERID